MFSRFASLQGRFLTFLALQLATGRSLKDQMTLGSMGPLLLHYEPPYGI